MKVGGLDRRCHWLSRNKTSKRPEALLFLDAEARIERPDERSEEHTFRLGVGCFCVYGEESGLQEREWRNLAGEAELWGWVEELSAQHEQLLIISHNIDYDARLCRAFYYLPRLDWTPSYAVMARSCTLFVWERGKQKITLLDNMNLWQASLTQLGESVGLPKLSVDFETVSEEDLFTYCHRDVEILVRLWRSWFQFLDEHDLGSFGITAAKQAFNAYRHRFMTVQIGIHNNAACVALSRKSYRGGRSECFFVGKAPPGRYYKVDVNGLYAAMMAWYPQPVKLVKVIQNVNTQFLVDLLERYLVIAEVVIEAREPVYTYRISGRNAYPTGSFFTTLTTPELQIALMNDEVRGIGQVALFAPADLFSEYVNYFTPLRQEYKATGDVARSRMCKLLRNSLQGKFGQLGHRQEIIGDAPLDKVAVRRWLDLESGRSCVDWTFGGKVLRQYDEGEPWDSLPAIPAHVAAYGRVYMWSLIALAGREHVYYIDTDSLIVDEEGYRNLAGVIDPSRLGFLKLEGVAEDLEINAKKDYRFGDLRTVKGIKDSAVQLSPDLYEQWHFTTIKFGFTAGSLDGVSLRKVQKQLHYNRVAGTVGADGWVRPPHLHLNPQDLFGYLANQEQDRVWVWEFDEDWLRRVEALEHLAERATYELSLLPQPAPSHRPPLLHLEPLGAS